MGLEDADRRNDIRAKGLLHVDLREPPTPFLGMAQRPGQFTQKASVLRSTDGFAVHFQTSSNGRYAFKLFGRRWSVQIVCSIFNDRCLKYCLASDRTRPLPSSF